MSSFLQPRFLQARYDAIVIGSGPNGLAAGITLAKTGRKVLIVEGQPTIGGGTRSAELTLPGFLHDVCSAVHPMAVSSPFFRSLSLADHGLQWIHPPAPLAHPLDDGTAVMLERSVELTASNLGEDGDRYISFMNPFVTDWPKLQPLLLGALRFPSHPLAAGRFGWYALRSATSLATGIYRGARARALFAGIATHPCVPLDQSPCAAFALVLAIAAHAVGWPIAQGGSHNIANALESCFRSLGGEIVTHIEVQSIEDLPATAAILCDVTPRQLLRIAGSRFPVAFRRKLQEYRYGPGVCKVDWALDGPIPWKAPACLRAGTVHLGGTFEEIVEAERAPAVGQLADKPFVLLAQPTLFDNTRAPAGKHIAWAYCHVPNGSSFDMTDRIENQIERFAPGFRARILKRHTVTASSMEAHNPNLVGGDIAGGLSDLRQFFWRPTRRLYRTPAKGVYMCSSSTPPGGGVHGLCGYLAAQAALEDLTRH